MHKQLMNISKYKNDGRNVLAHNVYESAVDIDPDNVNIHIFNIIDLNLNLILSIWFFSTFFIDNKLANLCKYITPKMIFITGIQHKPTVYTIIEDSVNGKSQYPDTNSISDGSHALWHIGCPQVNAIKVRYPTKIGTNIRANNMYQVDVLIIKNESLNDKCNLNRIWYK